MEKLIKKVTLGEIEFKVGTNRNILVDVLEANEEYTDIMFRQTTDELKTDGNLDFKKMIKAKKISDLLKLQDLIPEVSKYALPKMLECANENIEAEKIIAYAEENEVDDVLYNGLNEFLLEAFTFGKQDKNPKVKFAIV